MEGTLKTLRHNRDTSDLVTTAQGLFKVLSWFP